ncbi:MAG: radical SAM protein [Candidatus Helarchaeales archaeon]
MTEKNPIVFGPVPSRRLGNSLGINNIPAKNCTYSCIYCQLGRTTRMIVKRQKFYEPQDIFNAVEEKIRLFEKKDQKIDYLTFVSDGEPTLDINLGKEIELLQAFGIKIAVITNASLIWDENVQKELKDASWVSLKTDAVDEKTWKKINRPHGQLDLTRILESVITFSHEFNGEIATETMMVKDVNDSEIEIKNIAGQVKRINPKKAYISIPIRPPAEKWVLPAGERSLNILYQQIKKQGISVELLISHEGSDFAFSGNIESDIINITSVHPMREDSLKDLLKKASSDWSIVSKLLQEEKIVEMEYEGHKFYVRALPK